MQIRTPEGLEYPCRNRFMMQIQIHAMLPFPLPFLPTNIRHIRHWDMVMIHTDIHKFAASSFLILKCRYSIGILVRIDSDNGTTWAVMNSCHLRMSVLNNDHHSSSSSYLQNPNDLIILLIYELFDFIVESWCNVFFKEFDTLQQI